jgi:hypothetical protein
MASEKPARDRAPIRVIELDEDEIVEIDPGRHGAGVDDAPDPCAAPGASRRDGRPIDPAPAARIVAAAAYAPHDRRDFHARPRLVIARRDVPPSTGTRGDPEAATGEPGQVICSCGLDGCRSQRARVERRDAAGGDPEV